jgi:ribose/xylose/arabinose/galactoside ABC-type transport system permease subunit
MEKRMKRQSGLAAFIGQRWAVVFLVIEFVTFSFVGAGFFSLNGIQIVLFYGTSLFLLATAETFVIVTGGIDLSIGYLMGFATIVSAKLAAGFSMAGAAPGCAILLSILITLAVGAVPGIASGILVGYMKVPPFLATFATGGIFYGISLLLIGGVAAKDVPILANDIGNSYFLYWAPGRGLSLFSRPEVARGTYVMEIVPTMLVVTGVFVAAAAFVLKRTRFGRHAYAIGGNIDAAVRAGIDTKRHLLVIYVISALFAAFSGLIYMLEYVTGKADAGAGFQLDSIVAVVIGGASLYGGMGTVGGTVLGCLILQVLETGLRMAGIQPFSRFIAVGAILIIAVLIDQFFPELIHKED